MAESHSDTASLEGQLPAASGQAFAAARERALRSGQSVLQSEDGVLYEVFPDGTRKKLKEIDPPVSVVAGSKINIR